MTCVAFYLKKHKTIICQGWILPEVFCQSCFLDEKYEAFKTKRSLTSLKDKKK